MKQLTIIGNLGANAVLRTTSDGKSLMSFNVAVSAGSQGTVWFNCIGNLRDKLFPFLVKGQCVCVQGDLSARVYNGNIDLSVSIDRVELCGRAPATNEPTQTAAEPAPELSPVNSSQAQIASGDTQLPL